METGTSLEESDLPPLTNPLSVGYAVKISSQPDGNEISIDNVSSDIQYDGSFRRSQ